MNNIIKKTFSSASIIEKKEKVRNKIKNRSGLSNRNLWKKFTTSLIMKILNKIINIANIIRNKIFMNKSDIKVVDIEPGLKESNFINENKDITNENMPSSKSKIVNKIENGSKNKIEIGNGNEIGNENENEIESKNDKNIKILNPIYSGSAKSKWIAKTSKKNMEENEKLLLVGLFVYAWITPTLRRRFFGNVLLACGEEMCRELGADFMILVHDDDGSGRLISYYEKKGFIPIFDTIEKGMIGII